MRGVQDQLENAMYRWQMANREGSEDSENSGMLTCVTLCKPSVPVEQLKAGEVRSVLSSWIRALSPGNASPNYGDPTARPVYWPETVPWQPPSKPPKGFPDWTGALKDILRNILLHVGEDPDTYYRADADQSNPDRPISPDGPTNSTVQPTPAIPDLSTNPDRPTDRSTDPDRLTNSVGPTNDDIPTNLHRTTPDRSTNPIPNHHSTTSTPDFSMLQNSPDNLSSLVQQHLSPHLSPPYPPPPGVADVSPIQVSPIQVSPIRQKRAHMEPQFSPRQPSLRLKKPRNIWVFTPSNPTA
ncbi:uncharacterized protein LOC144924064 [Branchiostoma floridae x Branchiostoma belcheri]